MVLHDDTTEREPGGEPMPTGEWLRREGYPFPSPVVGPTRQHIGRFRDRALEAMASRARIGANLLLVLLIVAALTMAYRSQRTSTETVGRGITTSVESGATDASETAGTSPGSDQAAESRGIADPTTDHDRSVGPVDTLTTTTTATTPDRAGAASAADGGSRPSSTADQTGSDPATTASVTPEPTSGPPSTTASSEATTSTSTATTSVRTETTLTSTASTVEARPDALELDEGKDKSIKVLENDTTDARLDKDTLEVVDPPRHAAAYRVHGDHIHYRSADDYLGIDTLTYRICDTEDHCATATVTVTVTS